MGRTILPVGSSERPGGKAEPRDLPARPRAGSGSPSQVVAPGTARLLCRCPPAEPRVPACRQGLTRALSVPSRSRHVRVMRRHDRPSRPHPSRQAGPAVVSSFSATSKRSSPCPRARPELLGDPRQIPGNRRHALFAERRQAVDARFDAQDRDPGCGSRAARMGLHIRDAPGRHGADRRRIRDTDGDLLVRRVRRPEHRGRRGRRVFSPVGPNG